MLHLSKNTYANSPFLVLHEKALLREVAQRSKEIRILQRQAVSAGGQEKALAQKKLKRIARDILVLRGMKS